MLVGTVPNCISLPAHLPSGRYYFTTCVGLDERVKFSAVGIFEGNRNYADTGPLKYAESDPLSCAEFDPLSFAELYFFQIPEYSTSPTPENGTLI